MPVKETIQVKLAAANPNLSPATRFGNLVFVAGQTGRHPATSLENVLTVTTHLTKREDLAAYNEEYNRYFPIDKPARTTVEVMLNMPELVVEITVIACIPG